MKKKKEISGIGIVSTVFIGIGISFALGGIIPIFVVDDDKANIVSYVISGLGTIFLVLGILFMSIKRKKRKVQQRLKSEGQYVMAHITRIFMNTSITYGNEHPYKIYCRYIDEEGISHKFHSNNVMFNPNAFVKDPEIRVYVNRNDYKQYYVDTDSLMPNESQTVVKGEPLNTNKAFMFMGIVFMLLSLIPIGIGIILFMRFQEAIIIGIISMIALPFLIIGLSFLINEIHKKKLYKKCRENNQYVMAEIISINRDPSAQLSGMAGAAMVIDALKNGAPGDVISTEAYYFECVYESNDGIKHVFRGESSFKTPAKDIIGKEVKVFYCGKNMKRYFIDEINL